MKKIIKGMLYTTAICFVLSLFAQTAADKTTRQLKQLNNIDTMENPLLIEQTEIAAWSDLIDAAPDSFRQANGLRHQAIGGGMAINFQKEPIPLFNRVIGLGLTQPMTKQKMIL